MLVILVLIWSMGRGGGGGREKNRERDLLSIVICYYFNIIMEGFNFKIFKDF